MTQLPTWHATPLRVATLRDTCRRCKRTFQLEAYSGQDMEEVNRTMTALMSAHTRHDHPEGPPPPEGCGGPVEPATVTPGTDSHPAENGAQP